MESLEQLSLVGKNCLPPTSGICSVEGIFKDIYAIIFIPDDKICMQMAYLQKSESKKRKKPSLSPSVQIFVSLDGSMKTDPCDLWR